MCVFGSAVQATRPNQLLFERRKEHTRNTTANNDNIQSRIYTAFEKK